MSPTHTNKRGARYRYYVSQALLQKKEQSTGSVGRVPGPEIEELVLAALRHRFIVNDGQPRLLNEDRELIERHLERVMESSNDITLRLSECETEPPLQPDANHNTAD